MKDVDLGEPTSFFDHVYFGCTQRECHISKDIVDNYRTMFEARISAGAKEKRLCSGKHEADIFYALMTINSKKKNWDLLENCQTNAFKLS